LRHGRAGDPDTSLQSIRAPAWALVLISGGTAARVPPDFAAGASMAPAAKIFWPSRPVGQGACSMKSAAGHPGGVYLYTC
tara:strand:- start:4769 stop:5008 length:240 start_codon:yes stop_codon:yes gene_type:complete